MNADSVRPALAALDAELERLETFEKETLPGIRTGNGAEAIAAEHSPACDCRLRSEAVLSARGAA